MVIVYKICHFSQRKKSFILSSKWKISHQKKDSKWQSIYFLKSYLKLLAFDLSIVKVSSVIVFATFFPDKISLAIWTAFAPPVGYINVALSSPFITACTPPSAPGSPSIPIFF